jgi:hypothetical protein
VFQSVFPLNILTTQIHENDNFGPEKKNGKSSGDGCVSTVKSHSGDNNFGPEKKKYVRVVGTGVCLPLRVTEVTILALKKKM